MGGLVAIVLILPLVATACSNPPPPSPSQPPPPPPSPRQTPTPAVSAPPTAASPEPSPADPVAALAADLRAAGATVDDLGGFNPMLLGGRGARVCVAGQQVDVYAYESAPDRVAAAARIDATDPSKVGTAIVEWAGNPRFWQRDRLIVLYLGSDPAVEGRITSVLGEPFARGWGPAWDPGPSAYAC